MIRYYWRPIHDRSSGTGRPYHRNQFIRSGSLTNKKAPDWKLLVYDMLVIYTSSDQALEFMGRLVGRRHEY